jgi:DNA-binding NtrC family response regulator
MVATRGSHRTREGAERACVRLIQLHRNSLVSVLVVGGGSAQRRQLAFAFHAHSPARSGPFVAVDCRRDEPRLHQALQSWILELNPVPTGPLPGAGPGTLFLDHIGALSLPCQRLLLTFARGMSSPDPSARDTSWVGRLAAGTPDDLGACVTRGTFSGDLFDFLDKVRVDLGPRHARRAS